MFNSAVLEQITAIKGDIEKSIKDKVAEIVSLCEQYRYLGKNFGFSDLPDLDMDVNEELVQLSDDVLEAILKRLRKALRAAEEDDWEEELIEYAERERDGVAPLVRLDSYASHLKYAIEGWLAVGFANKLLSPVIATDIVTYMRNPMSSPEWQRAFNDGRYTPEILRAGGYNYGSGVLASPIEGMALIGQQMINEAYQMGSLYRYRSYGAIGYRVHRGSTYQCGTCDELCVGIHPISEIVLPAHPRCCCWTTPVYKDEADN